MRAAVDDVVLAGFARTAAERHLEALVAREVPAIVKEVEGQAAHVPHFAAYICGDALNGRVQALEELRKALG